MKILVIGDLHGRKPILKFKDFDCIVQTGDVCDDRGISKLYKKYFNLIKKRDIDLGWEDFILKEVGKKNYNKLMRESLKKGNEILKYLDKFNKPIFFIPGNWDRSYGKSRIEDYDKSPYYHLKAFLDWWLGDEVNKKLIKGVKNLRDCQYKNQEFMGFNFIGYGLSSGDEKPSSNLKRKKKIVSEKQFEILNKAYEKLNFKLKNVYMKRNKKLKTIFLTHNIPYNTKLDLVTDKKSAVYGLHLGSTVARNFCIKYKPILCIGGHIHEGKGKSKLGKTTLVNPGYGVRAQVLIDMNEKTGKVKSIKFWK